MKGSIITIALAISAAPLVAAQKDAKPTAQPITLQGCVRAGTEPNTFLMTDVMEVPSAGRSAVPPDAHGRKVIFWLDKDDMLRSHVGHVVEVRGTTQGIEKSEVELKAGKQKDGGLVVEFEGPGRDVKASNADVGQALGTSGRIEPEKNDVKTFLFKVHVDGVSPTTGTCR